MSSDSFDAFRKKLKRRNEAAAPAGAPADEAPPAEESAEAAGGEEEGGDALARMRAARARLDSLKSKSQTPGAPGGRPPADEEAPEDDDVEAAGGDGPAEEGASKRQSAAELFRAGRARAAATKEDASGPEASPPGPQGGAEAAKARLGGDKPGARKLGGAGKLGGSDKLSGPGKPGGARKSAVRRESGGQRAMKSDAGAGDEFEQFRRAKADASFEDAKRLAFEEGVEVEGLDRSRLAHDRVEKKTVEELGVTRHPMVHTFKDADESGVEDPVAAEFSGDRPEAYDTHRSRRLTVEELGDIEKPEHFETHRAKRQNVEELDLHAPERLTSHRHKRKKADPLAEEDLDEEGDVKIEGFKRFEF